MNCGPFDYLRPDVRFENANGPRSSYCFANKGTYKFTESGPGTTVWVDKISTGKDWVNYHDANGTTVAYRRHYIISFPARPPHVDWIEIL
ncbi:beta/gamma crystallin domain-containing protein [Streptomyces anthocyanicus]|uniref:beta/gamma crystallin domain-containing protein n=1 Tax=Streptomyces anthocyanicus TaxID=68174 RepID=UPI00364B86E3